MLDQRYTTDLSVIVPLYNREKCILRCIESIVLSCAGLDYEIIVVDDGSTDGGANIVDTLIKNNDRVRLIRKSNGGAASARNVGIDRAVGKYICFVDSDDIIVPQAYADCTKLLDSMAYDMLHFDYKIYRGHEISDVSPESLAESYVPPTDYALFSPTDYITKVMSTGDLSSCVSIYKKSLLDDNNLRYTEGIVFSEDTVLVFEISNCNPKIINVAQPYYCYLFVEGSVTRCTDVSRRKRNNDVLVDTIINFQRFISYPSFASDPEAVNVICVLKDTRLFKYLMDLIRLDYTSEEIDQGIETLRRHGALPLGKYPDLKEFAYGDSLRFKLVWRFLQHVWVAILAAKTSSLFRLFHKSILMVL